jgi:hypothetical protein
VFEGKCNRLQKHPVTALKSLQALAQFAIVSFGVLCAAAPAGAQITETAPPAARPVISVDAAQPAGSPIPRTIFGSFLEPIGNSINGGLWAEIL